MRNDEIIILDNVPQTVYTEIASKAVRYALISSAFTYDRMDKKDTLKRIYNITKGKIAEGIFFNFCNENNINIDTTPCTTPFWLPDLRDFLYLGGEWDIKNNFFYCSDHEISSFDVTGLPALIPNKHSNDQWSKRNEHYLEPSRYSAYLFTFMRLFPGKKDFFKVKISEQQLSFLNDVARKYHQSPYGDMPFFESWFYSELAKYGDDQFITMQYYPELYITSCANARYWSLFKNTSADGKEYNYQYLDTEILWYQPSAGIIRFLDGKIVTTIQNMTCPVAYLPSFRSVIQNINKD
jgi:hypothetical protein